MGNRHSSHPLASADDHLGGGNQFDTRRRYQQHKRDYCLQDEYRSKTLPARHSHEETAKSGNQHKTQQNQERLGSSSFLGGAGIPDGSPGGGGGGANAHNATPTNGETSRLLFLLYLIHRTWNVVMDTMDTRTKSRSTRGTAPQKHANGEISQLQEQQRQRGVMPAPNMEDGGSIAITDIDNIDGSSYCSQYSCCSCSYCYEEAGGGVGRNTPTNVYSSIGDDDYSQDSIYGPSKSICRSETSTLQRLPAPTPRSRSRSMAPSVCEATATQPPHKAPGSGSNSGSVSVSATGTNMGPGGCGAASNISGTTKCGSNSLSGSLASYKMGGSEQSWPQAPVFSKENQRPPVYNPEDYVISLRKFTKGSSSAKVQTIYDVTTSAIAKDDNYKSSTLPTKHSNYKSPIPAPAESGREMTLRQFATITDLLTKLRADLRVSFPSFVQEFVATPADGISHLLEVLRAIQMAQASNAPGPMSGSNTMAMALSRNSQSYQRRALLDELSCLQCLSICCSRSLDAIARLGNTPVGLMPLASSATGQGIRARILALHLLASACDKQAFGNGSQTVVAAGHTAVSEAMSTLRLRCSEPVRFRLLIGILNSGGGSGELQCAGVKFLNTFIESAINLQQRLYIQAELFQAGFEPSTLARTISSSSPWLDALRIEVKRFNELYIDVDKMMSQARDADRVRSQMVILERRVQILHEEKAVLTSMERRLQERCAELQREIFRLQGAQESNFKPVETHTPVALPRQVPPTTQTVNKGKLPCSEHEDEGISSSETGASLSPVPILVLPQKPLKLNGKHPKQKSTNVDDDDDDAATIEDVIEELDNIVSEAEKQITISKSKSKASSLASKQHKTAEKDIVPVNIVPQPPRKSRSLAHLVAHTDASEQDGSEYGMVMLHNPADPATAERMAAMQTFFDEADYDAPETDKPYVIESPDIPEETNAVAAAYNANTNRELLDVIMNARHNDDDPTMQALRNNADSPVHATTMHAATAAHQTETVGNERQERCSSSNNRTRKPPAPAPPAQQFNGVFFMTGMNTPQKYPKPDITAALQARRVTKNVERLEAAFATHEALNESNMVREKSRSNQHIYFSSNPTMRLMDGPGPGSGPSPSSNPLCSSARNASARSRSHTQSSSKVTDLPSGLY